MKVAIDHELCTGHGRCYSLAPRVFAPDDDGYGMLIDDGRVPAGLESEARTAAINCPERAVTTSE